ncbi:MAG: hypothetical protein LBT51_00590 [Fusobacteriaceae bacterium]|jgi:hypothetical protein|nr:hypothetical protein [Fusobacteriaceae bacterium]
MSNEYKDLEHIVDAFKVEASTESIPEIAVETPKKKGGIKDPDGNENRSINRVYKQQLAKELADYKRRKENGETEGSFEKLKANVKAEAAAKAKAELGGKKKVDKGNGSVEEDIEAVDTIADVDRIEALADAMLKKKKTRTGAGKEDEEADIDEEFDGEEATDEEELESEDLGSEEEAAEDAEVEEPVHEAEAEYSDNPSADFLEEYKDANPDDNTFELQEDIPTAVKETEGETWVDIIAKAFEVDTVDNPSGKKDELDEEINANLDTQADLFDKGTKSYDDSLVDDDNYETPGGTNYEDPDLPEHPFAAEFKKKLDDISANEELVIVSPGQTVKYDEYANKVYNSDELDDEASDGIAAAGEAVEDESPYTDVSIESI